MPLRKRSTLRRRRPIKFLGRSRRRTGRSMLITTTKKRAPVTPLLMLKNPVIVPDRIRLKLTYAEAGFTMDSVAGNYVEYIFRGNSVFDPDFTGSGHQPLGYDQWSAFYNRYRVHGSSIRVDYQSQGSTEATGHVMYLVYPTQVSTGSSSISQAMEQPYSKYKCGSNDTLQTCVITHRQTTAGFLGYQSVEDSDDLQAAVNTNPAHNWYWSVSQCPVNLSSNTDTNFSVRLIYDVEFFDRVNLAQS